MADPDVEVGVDPRSGEDARQFGRRRRRFRAGFAHRHSPQLGVSGEPAVYGPEERATAPLEVFPRVLTVEDDRDERLSFSAASPIPAAGFDQFADEVVRRRVGGPARVREADQVRQRVIAKHAGHGCPAGFHHVRRVEPLRLLDVTVVVPREGDAERSRENQLVGGHPREAALRDERHHRVRHRPFRRPETGRSTAEQAFMVRRGARELLRRVLGMAKPLPRHPRIGMRRQIHVGVAQQRQNRVIERRRRHFDLPTRHGFPVFRDDAVQQLELDVAEDPLVVFGEIALLRDQGPHSPVLLQVDRIDPRKLVPDLKVAQVVAREPRRGRAAVRGRGQRSAAEREQLGVPWVHLNHALVLRVEEILEDEIDIAVGEVGGRPEAQLEVPVARAIGRERLELHEHRGYQVEGHLHLRELAHQRGHAVVILQRVEPHPRKDVLPRDEVFVERLMHVPQDGDASHNRLTA